MKFTGLIYLFKSYHPEHDIVYKIGITKNPIEERHRNLNTGNPSDLELITTYNCRIKPATLEARLHRMFKYCHVKGEWFALNDNDVIEFNQYCKNAEDALIAIGKK